LECGGSAPLLAAWAPKSATELAHSKTFGTPASVHKGRFKRRRNNNFQALVLVAPGCCSA
jgi:hypothetical protein